MVNTKITTWPVHHAQLGLPDKDPAIKYLTMGVRVLHDALGFSRFENQKKIPPL